MSWSAAMESFVMEPTRLERRVPHPPMGNLLTRAFVSIFREGRLPYAASQAIDKFCQRIGLHCKKIRIDGLRIQLRRLTTDVEIVQHIVADKEYNPPGYEIHEQDTVIDVGANIGAFALLSAQSARKGKVFAFEPIAANYRLLLRNIALNQAHNVIPCKKAVLNENKSIRIFLDPHNTGGHSVFSRGEARGYEDVDCVTFKDVFDQHRIERCHFLKLDCEGSEYAILFDLPREYYSRIDRIVMEYHGELATKRSQADKMVSFLQEAGYHIDSYLDVADSNEGFIFARRKELRS